jgi:hypothetical protein
MEMQFGTNQFMGLYSAIKQKQDRARQAETKLCRAIGLNVVGRVLTKPCRVIRTSQAVVAATTLRKASNKIGKK